MQAKIMEQVKLLEPLSNRRIAIPVEEAIRTRGLLTCNQSDAQFNCLMHEGLRMGVDFEVISKDQWCLLMKYFSERQVKQADSAGAAESGDTAVLVSEDSPMVAPTPLVRSYELLGLGIRTQIEYFM